MDMIPPEIITYIFSYLSLRQVLKLQICHLFKNIIRNTKWNKMIIITDITLLHHIVTTYRIQKFSISNTNITNNNLRTFNDNYSITLINNKFITDLSHLKLCKKINTDKDIYEEDLLYMKNCYSVNLYAKNTNINKDVNYYLQDCKIIL